MPNNDAVVVPFEEENGADDNGAMQEACRNLARFEWSPDDVEFYFAQIEARMAAAGVKKQFTKFQTLTTILPKTVIDQVKSLLRKKETDFPNNDSYRLLKLQILKIFGPRPEDSIERAFNRVLSGKPSELARVLAEDVCKQDLDCPCCPRTVMAFWKRHLPSNVRAGIAHCTLTKDTFDEVVKLADDIFSANQVPTVAAIKAPTPAPSASLDETQPGLQYPVVQEVNAVRRGGGRGRGRGGARGRGRGGQQQSGQAQGGQRHRGPRHPDLPAGQWLGCSMHYRWGKGAHFCTEPSTCP